MLGQFLSLIRFSHTLFALPFALLAAVMAWTAQPPVAWHWTQAVGIVWCMVAARSAAMAFNRVADWKFDAENPRTATRHIPAGVLSVQSVTWFAVGCALLFVAGTLWFWPNWLPLALSLPVLAFLLGYSYTKRFTSLAHVWLGAALALAPVCAWIAIRGEAVLANPADLIAPAVLAAAILLWVSGFDIIYACQDADFDREAGLRSIPARLGVPGALRLAAALHAGMVLCLFALPQVFPLGGLYLAGIAAVAVLLVYEHWLVRPDDLSRVNLAFFYVNSVISVGLLAVGVADLWWR